jgi:5-methylcytosine-specific restriction endonuclease McrA
MPRQLTRRHVPRSALARLPRHTGGRRFAPPEGVAMQAKHAIKAAALRDCMRRCVYCAVCLEHATATLDHVYPRAHGGNDAPGNLVVSCARCNRLKGDLLPHEFFLRHPWAGANFMRYARAAHRVHKRNARRAVSLAHAA